METSTLAIIVPCYNEETVLPQTNQQLLGLLGDMMRDRLVGENSYILYVDDGSGDQTWSMIADFGQVNDHVRGLKLAANVGHQNALMAGLTAQGFYRFMRLMGVKTVYNHADFRLMSRRAVTALKGYEERNLFLRGLVPQLGYRSDQVFYDRLQRQGDESKYPFGKMLSFAVDGVTSFSVRPLRLIFGLGVFFLLISLAILVYVIVALVDGRGVQGWASIMLSIWFVGGCLLICLSVIAAYIGRIYTEGKHRPRYNIEKYIK